ncbi:hypothetical protein D3C75_1321870 [compost metagenome]
MDVESEERLIELETERATQEALIDYALATHNEKLFQFIMNAERADENTQE